MQDCHQKGVTYDRKFDSSKTGVRGIRELGQLHGGVMVMREV